MSITSRVSLGYYEGTPITIILTNPNDPTAEVRIVIEGDEKVVYQQFKLKSRETKIVEVKDIDKKGVLVVETNMGLIIQWGEYLCPKCKKSVMEFKLEKEDGGVKYKWVCPRCKFEFAEAEVRVRKRDEGVEIEYVPLQIPTIGETSSG